MWVCIDMHLYLYEGNSKEMNIRKKCYKILNDNFIVRIKSKTSHKITIKGQQQGWCFQCRNPEMANSNLMCDELLLKRQYETRAWFKRNFTCLVTEGGRKNIKSLKGRRFTKKRKKKRWRKMVRRRWRKRHGLMRVERRDRVERKREKMAERREIRILALKNLLIRYQ